MLAMLWVKFGLNCCELPTDPAPKVAHINYYYYYWALKWVAVASEVVLICYQLVWVSWLGQLIHS